MSNKLFNTVVQGTGLIQEPVEKELNALLTAQGFNASELTMEQLREVMIDYLNTVFLEISENEKYKSA
ncbi:MAG: hypothetical protein ACM3MG_12725 [Bacillota bacterium]